MVFGGGEEHEMRMEGSVFAAKGELRESIHMGPIPVSTGASSVVRKPSNLILT